MKESSLWQYLRKGMQGYWDATRIESSSGNGVPDVSYGLPQINGWLELKYIPTWPKRSSTPVKLPLRPEQKLWIQKRGKLSGNVWVMCRIENDFFLLNWEQAILATEGLTQARWFLRNSGYWCDKINFAELCVILRDSVS